MVTYALTAASVAAATEPQRLCDARLLAALNEMTASEQQTITLRLSMDSECRKGSTIVD